jgi:hypothetical protein
MKSGELVAMYIRFRDIFVSKIFVLDFGTVLIVFHFYSGFKPSAMHQTHPTPFLSQGECHKVSLLKTG